jgi:hypothetical protein
VAASRPLLLAVDDLHWCDLPSLRWLAYVLPRMEGLGLWIVVTIRHEDPGENPSLLAQIVSDPLATVIRPAPLSIGAAARFVRRTLSPDADDAFCAACHQETCGNPLLLRELMHAIGAEGLAPAGPNVPVLRELGARAGSRAVTLRLSRLRPESRRLARAVSILGDDADPRQAAALAGLDLKAASDAAGALAHADVLRPQPPLGFVHPIIRAAVYEALTPLERELGHARAAAPSATQGPSPNGSPRSCCALPRRRIQRSWLCCAMSRAALSLAELARARSLTFAARSPSHPLRWSAPTYCANLALPRHS